MFGAENEKVIMDDGVVYVLSYDSHTYKDRGRLLGTVNGAYGTSYYVFSVRNDPYQDYIYVASMGQGNFYRKIDNKA